MAHHSPIKGSEGEREIRAQKPSAEKAIKDSIAALCRREGISESLYYTWSKEFLGEVLSLDNHRIELAGKGL